MSAKGRGPKRGGANDFYETPDYVTKAVLPYVPIPIGGDVCDPCAGKGAILDVVRDAWEVDTHGYELIPEYAEVCRDKGHDVFTGDALSTDMAGPRGLVEWSRASLYIMNPPFSLAREFVVKALHLARAHGTHANVAVMLRQSFFQPDDRKQFRQDMPGDIYVMSPRPSFGLNKHGKPGNDATDYCWAVWRAHEVGLTTSRYRIIHIDKPRAKPAPRPKKFSEVRSYPGMSGLPAKFVAGIDLAHGPDATAVIEVIGGRIENGQLVEKPRP